jgi:hypothetical protein
MKTLVSTHPTIHPEDPAEKINSLLQRYPGGFYFSIEAFEDISHDKNLPCHQKMIDQGVWRNGFLTTMGWWRSVAHEFMDGPHEFEDEKEINDAMRETFELYPYADEGALAVAVQSVESNTAALGMLQKYWKHRNLICANVQKELPNANCNVLLKLI